MLTVALAAAALGASAWFVLRPARPLNVVDECWRAYRAARTAADTAAVDRRRVPVTPTVRDAPRDQAPFTCGIWRAEFKPGGAFPAPTP